MMHGPAAADNKQLEEFQLSIESMKEEVITAARTGAAAHVVEENLFRKLLGVGHQLMEHFFGLQGTGDIGETAKLADGRTIKRLPDLHSRKLVTIFGTHRLQRHVYGSREGQAIDLAPLDTRLQLPEMEYSYFYQGLSQEMAVEMPYSKVRDLLRRIFPGSVSVDTLETGNRHTGEHVLSFRESQPVPAADTEGAILVTSADGKGIPMRHERDVLRVEDLKSKRGPKPGRKRMATVGSVYTVDPFVRKPEDILEALFHDPTKEKPGNEKRPEPKNKDVFANLTRDDGAGNEITATDLTMKEIARQAGLRNPAETKVHVMLQDGQPSLWEAAKRHLQEGAPYVEVLDLIHVMGYLWKAAAMFGRTGWQQLEFMKAYALRVLRGGIRKVVGSLRQSASRRGFSRQQTERLEKICSYFLKNRHRMKYDEYLAAGYPIASGVIEGACRHYVKDRMERAGMRWSMDGAQAMLNVRSIALNGKWEQFVKFRIQKETEKNHPHHSVVQAVEWPLAA